MHAHMEYFSATTPVEEQQGHRLLVWVGRTLRIEKERGEYEGLREARGTDLESPDPVGVTEHPKVIAA